jgi:hypothetical protein
MRPAHSTLMLSFVGREGRPFPLLRQSRYPQPVKPRRMGVPGSLGGGTSCARCSIELTNVRLANAQGSLV